MIRSGVRRLFRLDLHDRDMRAREVDDEITLHIDLRTEQLVARGVPHDQARREAERRFGHMPQARHILQQSAMRTEARMALRDRLGAFWQDIAYAARSLRREPLLATVVVVTLALGIGANAAMFGIVDRLLLRGPEHVREPEGVARVYLTRDEPEIGRFTTATHGYVVYEAMKSAGPVFERVGAYSSRETTLGRGGDAASIRAGFATWDLFPLLGVRPALGRFFGADEDDVARPEKVVVLSHELWSSRFGSDSSLIGRTVDIGAEPYDVIGVAPAGFTGAKLTRVDLWLPMSLEGPGYVPDWPRSWNAQWLEVVARLAPGTTAEQAEAAAQVAHRRFAAEADTATLNASVGVNPLWLDAAGEVPLATRVSRWLVGVSVVVLLVACANVANLLLARGIRRRREVAVRLALGVSRGRLVRLLLAESTLLALAGALAALAVAWWGGRLVRVVLLPDVVWSGSPVDGRVLAFTGIVALLTALVVGLLPAMQASGGDVTGALREGAREGGGRRAGARAVLTVAQAALSVVLLVGAGLFLRSLQRVRSVDLGLQPHRVMTVSVRWPSISQVAEDGRSAERARRRGALQQLLPGIQALPGVERAAVTTPTPLRASNSMRLRAEGHDSIPPLPGGGPYVYAVTSDFFATMGMRLVAGRTFTPADRRGSEPVAVVSDLMARTLWPDGSAIGRCLVAGDEEDNPSRTCSRIVGVVGASRRFEIAEPASMQYYLPIEQAPTFGSPGLVVRPREGVPPSSITNALRREIVAREPGALYVDVRQMQELIEPQVRPWRLGASMFGVFGALALVVASIGLYSVVAYSVAQRSHEMGVRVALGARGGDIARIVVGSATGLTLVGLAIGVVLALLAGRFVEPLLFETSPREATIYAGVAATLLAMALLASVAPARRASRVDPVRALREE